MAKPKKSLEELPKHIQEKIKRQGNNAHGGKRMWAVDIEKEMELSQRREKVATNLLAGMTYLQIAKALDVSKTTIAGDVRWLLDELHNERILAITDFVNLELARLDRAMFAIWNDVISGKLPAIDRFLKISERRAKLLGLDKPQFSPDWKTTVVMLLQRGDVSPDRVITDFGDEVASELLKQAGIDIIDAKVSDE